MTDRDGNKLMRGMQKAGRNVCLGLDPDIEKIPKSAQREDPVETVLEFCQDMISVTKDVVGAFKPNAAFFEAHGSRGDEALETLFEHGRKVASDVPMILDGKRGDIGNTNNGYAKGAFGWKKADGLTIHPGLGQEANQTFLDEATKVIFPLVRTSNPGAREFQDRMVEPTFEEAREWGISTAKIPFYQLVAYRVTHHWSANGNVGMVVGATAPEELAIVRKIAPKTMLLVPGSGAQGGKPENVVKHGMDADGRGFLLSLSRSALYASGGEDYLQAARQEIMRNNEIVAATREKTFVERKSVETAS